MTSDMMVTVDENKCKYSSYAIYDKEFDVFCANLFDLINKWPRADESKCKYGVKTLRDLLPDIIASERKTYQKQLESLVGSSKGD